MLLEPSRGSKQTTKLPCRSLSTSTTLSISSDTSRHVVPELLQRRGEEGEFNWRIQKEKGENLIKGSATTGTRRNILEEEV